MLIEKISDIDQTRINYMKTHWIIVISQLCFEDNHVTLWVLHSYISKILADELRRNSEENVNKNGPKELLASIEIMWGIFPNRVWPSRSSSNHKWLKKYNTRGHIPKTIYAKDLQTYKSKKNGGQNIGKGWNQWTNVHK